jgi:hypothetical protein
VAGLRDIDTPGTRLMLAVARLVLSAALVAVTITRTGVLSEAGAVKRPDADTVPMAGLRDHDTAVFSVPETLAASCTD